MRRLTIMFMALALVGAACGDDGGGSTDASDTTTTSTPADTGSDDATTTTTEAAADFDISQVEGSVVQIQTQGTYEFIEGTASNAGATGTGFVISEDGLVVTNNHVVQGAATLAVSFSGEDPINARVLGVSECTDLAVIQLTGGGYQPLEFRDDPLTVGTDVFSAGYPGADDPGNFDDLDYTLTRGIVGSIEADGESSWASVDSVIQHDAQILGGNSGGPLVDENGHIVGVNYAGNDDFNTNYAIAAQDARPVIDQLANGTDVDSIGINGRARVFDSGLTGIWIRSVDSGSPADAAGIEAGDLLSTFENLVMATDGTMSDYCDVLRSNAPDATLDFELYRPSLDLLLEGQINGDPIEIPLITQTVITETGGNGSGDNGTAGGGEAPTSYSYVSVTDDQGLITVEVPTAWAEVDGRPNPDFGPSIWASPNIAEWSGGNWGVPGIIVESSSELTSADIPGLLAARDLSGVCTLVGEQAYEDPLYAGTLRIYDQCGGTGAFYVVLAASPLDPAQDYLVKVEVQAVTQADLEAADQALATFIANI